MGNSTVEISVHDNLLLSYTIDAVEKRITLNTAYQDREPFEYTQVVFTGVLVYHFEGDNFSTILFDVTEVRSDEVVEAYKELFAARKNYGWLPFDYPTEGALKDQLNALNVRGYYVESSYGMQGFVLCEQMLIEPASAPRSRSAHP